ncbi:MAG: hypothetical protein IBX62_05485 [Coriobacteriia bacterium]|nr:hypothetical protein [Coriobacteriia bacterium]
MAERDGKGGYWSGLEAAHRRRILLWGGLGVTLLAAVVAAALIMPPAEDGPERPGERSAEPTRTPEATPTPTPEPDPSPDGAPAPGPPPMPGPDEGNGSGPDAGGGSGTDASGPHLVAYRFDGSIRVVRTDGGEPKVVLEQDVPWYSLSPDGRTLAYGADRGFDLVDIASGRTTRIPARSPVASPASWAPDSSWLVYSVEASDKGESGELRRVSGDGGGGALLGTGSRPQVSPDGRRVASVRVSRGTPVVAVIPAGGGAASEVAATQGVRGFAWSSAKGLYAVVPVEGDPADTPPRIVLAGLGGGSEQVWKVAPGGRAVTLADLRTAPDGRSLLFAEVGDDGYSRAKVLRAGKALDLSIRRDTYPVGWTAESSVLFVEGNAFQGESTDLMRAKADGTGRRVLVRGAAR